MKNDNWINIMDEFPPQLATILVWQENLSDPECSRHQKAYVFDDILQIYPHIKGSYYQKKYQFVNYDLEGDICQITHWQLLPERPDNTPMNFEEAIEILKNII